jgi:hypothetical protein
VSVCKKVSSTPSTQRKYRVKKDRSEIDAKMSKISAKEASSRRSTTFRELCQAIKEMP